LENVWTLVAEILYNVQYRVRSTALYKVATGTGKAHCGAALKDTGYNVGWEREEVHSPEWNARPPRKFYIFAKGEIE
jgi:hypothetical protein